MRNRNLLTLLIALALTSWGCGGAPPGPANWLPEPVEAPQEPHGGWIEVEYAGAGGQRYFVEGELLAVGDADVFVLDAGGVQSVPLDSVATAKLGYYDPNAGSVVGIATAGLLSTISNGAFLVLTGPAWVAIGSGASLSRAADATVSSKKSDWNEFRLYARFPSGLPPGFYEGAERVSRVPPRAPGPPEAVPEPSRRLKPPPEKAFWADLGAGPGFVEGAGSDVSYIVGLNVAYRWFMIGTRLMSVKREVSYPPLAPAPGPGADTFVGEGRLYDVPLLIGVRGNYKSIHLTASAGPAAYGVALGDLSKFTSSMAAQAEFFVFVTDDFGLGSVFGYNWNDVANFYVISFAIAIGTR